MQYHVAVSLKKEGYNPALLNPANADIPGGGYKQGARALEEIICRRSGLAYAIDPTNRQVPNFYPLKGAEILYSPDVPIFRNIDYSYMDNPIPISVISSAAIDLNANHNANQVNNFKEETEKRIYAQLAVAAEQRNDAVVLTAFGCGAFQNNPEVVAKIYKYVIENYFKGVFKTIKFAIINDHNSGRTHNPQGNFKPFQETFGAT